MNEETREAIDILSLAREEAYDQKTENMITFRVLSHAMTHLKREKQACDDEDGIRPL